MIKEAGFLIAITIIKGGFVKKLSIIGLFILASCSNSNIPTISSPTPDPVDSSQKLVVAAFNVQIFGLSKMSKPEVVNSLVKIIPRYDLILIQEIRDSSGTAILDLLGKVNQASGNKYGIEIGNRVGRSSSKEQYAFFYNKNKLKVLDKLNHVDSLDVFEREPFLVKFNWTQANIDFFTMGIHTKPEDALNEINALKTVYDSAAYNWNTSNSIILGDLNSDCSYLSDTEWLNLSLIQDTYFSFWFDKSGDSTTGNSVCQYDQIVTTSRLTNFVETGSNHIFDFKSAYGLNSVQAQDVSDHFPVELTFSF